MLAAGLMFAMSVCHTHNCKYTFAMSFEHDPQSSKKRACQATLTFGLNNKLNFCCHLSFSKNLYVIVAFVVVIVSVECFMSEIESFFTIDVIFSMAYFWLGRLI